MGNVFGTAKFPKMDGNSSIPMVTQLFKIYKLY